VWTTLRKAFTKGGIRQLLIQGSLVEGGKKCSFREVERGKYTREKVRSKVENSRTNPALKNQVLAGQLSSSRKAEEKLNGQPVFQSKEVQSEKQ